ESRVGSGERERNEVVIGGAPRRLDPHRRRNLECAHRLPRPPAGAVSRPAPRSRSPLMLSRVRTAALWGFEALAVDCEVDVGPGLPAFVLIGLPDASARES